MFPRLLMTTPPGSVRFSLITGALIAGSLFVGCAPSFSQLVANGGGLESESDEVDPREQQRFDEALAILRERARERAASASTEPSDGGDPLHALPVVVAAPPSPWTADGQLRRAALDQLIEAGPHAVLGLAEWTPVRQQDRAIGLEMRSPRYAADVLASIGLQDGDVVRTVNGESVLLPDAFVRAWEGLVDCETIIINIERGGSPVSLTLQVAADDESARAASN